MIGGGQAARPVRRAHARQTSGSGRLTGSTTTSGMPSSRTWRSCGMVSSDVTRITPSVSWLASALVQLAGRALPCRTAETVGAHGVRRAPVLDAPQDLHRPRAVQSVEDEVDQPGPASPPRSRTLVLALAEQPLDQRAGIRRDVRPAVHDLGNRRQRDSRLRGDGGQRRTVPAARLRRVSVAARLGPRHVPSTLLPRPYLPCSVRSRRPARSLAPASLDRPAQVLDLRNYRSPYRSHAAKI